MASSPKGKKKQETPASKAANAARKVGTLMLGQLKWFNISKGFGFVTVADGGEDLFLHHADIVHEDPEEKLMSPGQNIRFTYTLDKGRPKATQITRPDGSPLRRPHTSLITPKLSWRLKKHPEIKCGIVKWFDDKKGFGFITPCGDGQDTFVHQSQIQSAGRYRTLVQGMEVEYKLEENPKKSDKQKAQEVTGPGGELIDVEEGAGGRDAGPAPGAGGGREGGDYYPEGPGGGGGGGGYGRGPPASDRGGYGAPPSRGGAPPDHYGSRGPSPRYGGDRGGGYGAEPEPLPMRSSLSRAPSYERQPGPPASSAPLYSRGSAPRDPYSAHEYTAPAPRASPRDPYPSRDPYDAPPARDPYAAPAPRASYSAPAPRASYSAPAPARAPARETYARAPARAPAPAARAPRKGGVLYGTVKWFNATKKYGFITPGNGGEDVFVHLTGIVGEVDLTTGQSVEYVSGIVEGQSRAIEVTGPRGAPLAASTSPVSTAGGPGVGYGDSGGSGSYGGYGERSSESLGKRKAGGDRYRDSGFAPEREVDYGRKSQRTVSYGSYQGQQRY